MCWCTYIYVLYMYLSHYALAWLSTFYFCSLRYTVGPRFRMLCVSLVSFIGLNYAMRISLGLGLFLASRLFCERNYSRLNDSSAKGLLRCHPAHQFIYFNEEHNWCSHILLSIITLNFLVQLEGVYNVNLAGHPSMS